jgi:expansin (peptidoglycan-binding protein)
MAYTRTMMGGGCSAGQALSIAGGVATALTAAGTTQATALALGPLDVNMIGTCAAGAGVILLTGAPGDKTTVYNGGANACLVYPPVGAKVNSLTTNAGVTLATNTAILMTCVSGTQWVGNLSA